MGALLLVGLGRRVAEVLGRVHRLWTDECT
jgi:hypothetical protein